MSVDDLQFNAIVNMSGVIQALIRYQEDKVEWSEVKRRYDDMARTLEQLAIAYREYRGALERLHKEFLVVKEHGSTP